MNAESVGKDFGIGGVLVSVCSLSNIDWSGLSSLKCNLGKQWLSSDNVVAFC